MECAYRKRVSHMLDARVGGRILHQLHESHQARLGVNSERWRSSDKGVLHGRHKGRQPLGGAPSQVVVAKAMLQLGHDSVRRVCDVLPGLGRVVSEFDEGDFERFANPAEGGQDVQRCGRPGRECLQVAQYVRATRLPRLELDV